MSVLAPVTAQLPVELLPALLGKEDPRPLEPDVTPHAGDGVGQPVAPLLAEVDVVGAPADERRRGEPAELRLDGYGIRRVEGGEETLEVADALRSPQVRC